ncbi:hypothetical protein [Sulfitobacter sp. R18_1]|uniref:hypothetical protein n=1 Tax=Sulfitobacter sp. R18_1 TaxID=2821104 RepID=UPI001ADACEAD|nr:hypothetical protein [Sulfitobacter sp. R18_1]MBO9428050.1 hypothetical protein [Sulfitobacter sp. R18_1]
MNHFAREKLDEVVDNFVWGLPETEFSCMSTPESGFDLCQQQLTSDYAFVDAIIAALPGLVTPLEWHKGGDRASDWKSESPLHSFLIYENAQDGWTLDDGMAKSPHDTVVEAQEDAQKRYTSLIMAALGITEPEPKEVADHQGDETPDTIPDPTDQELQEAVADQHHDVNDLKEMMDADEDLVGQAREKMAEAIWREGIGRNRKDDVWPNDVIGQSQDLFRSKSDAVIAALPTLAPTLEWMEIGVDGKEFESGPYTIHNAMGVYTVIYKSGEYVGDDKVISLEDTLEAAKAAAQEHSFKELMGELYKAGRAAHE